MRRIFCGVSKPCACRYDGSVMTMAMRLTAVFMKVPEGYGCELLREGSNHSGRRVLDSQGA